MCSIISPAAISHKLINRISIQGFQRFPEGALADWNDQINIKADNMQTSFVAVLSNTPANSTTVSSVSESVWVIGTTASMDKIELSCTLKVNAISRVLDHFRKLKVDNNIIMGYPS